MPYLHTHLHLVWVISSFCCHHIYGGLHCHSQKSIHFRACLHKSVSLSISVQVCKISDVYWRLFDRVYYFGIHRHDAYSIHTRAKMCPKIFHLVIHDSCHAKFSLLSVIMKLFFIFFCLYSLFHAWKCFVYIFEESENDIYICEHTHFAIKHYICTPVCTQDTYTSNEITNKITNKRQTLKLLL